MLERLYECFGTEERIGLICHINGMEMGWMNFVIENIYEEGDVVRVETGDSYIRLEPKLYEEVPVGEGENLFMVKIMLYYIKWRKKSAFKRNA